THDQEEATSISDYILLMKLGVMQQFSATREIYNDPANLFVADFIGNPEINQIKGVYKENGIQPDGCSFVIPVEKDIPQYTRIVLAVRPESLVFDNDSCQIPASVNEIYVSGKDTLVSFNIGENVCRGYCDAEFSRQPGEVIKVGLKEKGVFVFNQETGERY
ncbi:MAG: ABC transporter ATP-binding protein, partial [Erysipelotrichaceae bacterium]|nr:ABC transporter ATP-binding protein [Erysipelotrichaceae bacterium]